MPPEVINAILGALAVVLGWWLRHQFGVPAASTPLGTGGAPPGGASPVVPATPVAQAIAQIAAAAEQAIVNSHVTTAAQAVGKIQPK